MKRVIDVGFPNIFVANKHQTGMDSFCILTPFPFKNKIEWSNLYTIEIILLKKNISKMSILCHIICDTVDNFTHGNALVFLQVD